MFAYAATYDEYTKENGKLKIGTVQYKTKSLKRLNGEKAQIEREYQRCLANYNTELARVNEWIVEANKLGVPAVSP